MAFSYYSPETVQSGQVPSTQTDFAMLVFVTDNRLRTVGNGGHVQNSNGYDIRPYSDTGLTSAMTYQLQTYNASTGQLIMWVKVSSLAVGSIVYIAYGDSGISTDGSSSSTWDSNFKAVYHLEESPTGSAPQFKDSTSNGKDLTVTTTGGSPANVTGQIGSGINFPTTIQYSGTTAISSGNVGVGATNNYTVSGWFYMNSYLTVDGYPVQLFGTSGGAGYNIGPVINTGDKIAFAIHNDPGFGNKITTSSTVATGSWKYFTGTNDGTNLTFYLNAVSQATLAQGSIGDAPAFIGGSFSNGMGFRFSDFRVDEMRLSASTRSANWITTEYNNQSAPGTFAVLGTEVPVSSSAIKNINGLARASVKNINGLAIASMKNWNGLA